ncbi:kelch-like protein 17 [Paramacrobiotus metropolitanus]|uniref:kelch-like protein 17 n=1 Tax=Paramacrobiotus metropolitanus TaxID=2943436 RepID=UPI0024459101|nr:kelch-like protein 17 [Paramacrobiotus metropolitanus]
MAKPRARPKKSKPARQQHQKPTTMQLRIGGATLSVNKDALIRGSPYFAAMLDGNFQESGAATIELQQPENVHLETLVKLVEHLSSGDAKTKLSVERKDAVRVWMAAKYLQMDEAVEMAEDILHEIMQRPKNLYRLWRLARRDGLMELERLTFREIVQHHPRRTHFTHSEEFLKCTAEEVKDLLTEEEYIPESEAAVYQAVLRWRMHDCAGRNEDLHRLLDECVVWDHLDMESLRASSKGPLNAALTQILANRCYGLMGGGASLKRAIPQEVIFYHMREGHPHQLLRFDFARNELVKLESPLQGTLAERWSNIPHEGFAVAAGRELIVATGDSSEREVIAMDCISGSTRPLMVNSPFFGSLCLVAVGDRLYRACEASSGYGENWYCHDMSTGKLRRVGQIPFYTEEYHSSPLRYNRHSMQAYALPNGRIWFLSVGSVDEKDDDHPKSCVESYDIHSNMWEEHASWKGAEALHHDSGIIVFQGYLYFTGGCMYDDPSLYTESYPNATTACYRVSLTRAFFPERIADLNMARYHHSVFIKNGKIWVYGGTTHVDGDNQRNRALTTFEAYDAETDQWTMVEVPMSKELQDEVAGGDYAQKTFCLPLQYRLPPVHDGNEFRDRDDNYEYVLKENRHIAAAYGEGDDSENDSDDDSENDSDSGWPAGLDG